jgi:hypothetical protein
MKYQCSGQNQSTSLPNKNINSPENSLCIKWRNVENKALEN